MTPDSNEQGGVLFLWLVGMRPLLLRHLPFRDMLKFPSSKAFQPELNQTYVLGHALVQCFVLLVYLFDHQLGVTLYDDFF